MNFRDELNSYIRAGYPILYVTALEPVRAIAEIEKVCDDINSGIGDDPDEVCGAVDNFADNSVAILCNYHAFIGENPDPVRVQSFIDAYSRWKSVGQNRTVIILSPIYKVAPELERFVQTLTYTLPDTDQITSIVDSMATQYKEIFTWDSDEHRIQVISNASGMTEDEVESSLALSMVKSKMNTGTARLDADIIMEEKAKILEKTGY